MVNYGHVLCGVQMILTINLYFQKLKKATASIGYEMLDVLTIPFDREDPDVEKSAVTVGLTVDGPVAWQPTKLKGKTWDPFSKEMLQVALLLIQKMLHLFDLFLKKNTFVQKLFFSITLK